MAPTAFLPRHPVTGMYAIGVLPSGRPVWPCMGGDESEDAAAQAAAAKAAADKAAADAERGYPEGTPVADMTAEQQAAYWKHQSRKHESRVSSLGNLTAEKLAELQAKAKKADDYEAQQGTETEKAVRSAYTEAEEKADAKYRPLLVKAKFEALAAGRIEDAQLATILEPLNLNAFLAADGSVDTAKVKTYVDGIAPKQEQRKGPTSSGAGGGKPAHVEGTAEERAKRRAERLGIKQPAAQ